MIRQEKDNKKKIRLTDKTTNKRTYLWQSFETYDMFVLNPVKLTAKIYSLESCLETINSK